MLEGKTGSRLSVTAKITIWYVAFLLIISMLIMFAFLNFYNQRLALTAESKLTKVIDEVGDNIVNDGESFIVDKNIHFYYKDTYISVYDKDGNLITGRRPRGIDEFPPLTEGEIRVIKDVKGSDWFIYDIDIEVNGQKMYVRGMINDLAADEDSTFTLIILLVMIPVVILLALLGGFFITKRAFAPVREIINTTNEISQDADLSRRIPLGNSEDEIYELAVSINGMFDRIEEVIEREKQFTSDVSHELRTPIAVIQSQSEFAMEDDEYAPRAAMVINRASRRMASLISSLLTLSRGDSGRIQPLIEDVDMSFLLTMLIELRESADVENVEIESDIAEGITAKTDADMTTRIIYNLLDNAIKYGNKDSRKVKVTLFEDGDEAVCRIADNGKGVSESEREKIWQRFYRSDIARDNEESAGLGLSMVEALTNAIGGKVSLLKENDPQLGGAVFELRLPAVK